MELKPEHIVSLISKETGASIEIEVENGFVVVRSKEIEATITLTPKGVHIQSNCEMLIGRFKDYE